MARHAEIEILLRLSGAGAAQAGLAATGDASNTMAKRIEADSIRAQLALQRITTAGGPVNPAVRSVLGGIQAGNPASALPLTARALDPVNTGMEQLDRTGFRVQQRMSNLAVNMLGLRTPVDGLINRFEYLDFMAQRMGTNIGGLLSRYGGALAIGVSAAALAKGAEFVAGRGAAGFVEAGVGNQSFFENLLAGMGAIDTDRLRVDSAEAVVARVSARSNRLQQFGTLAGLGSADEVRTRQRELRQQQQQAALEETIRALETRRQNETVFSRLNAGTGAKALIPGIGFSLAGLEVFDAFRDKQRTLATLGDQLRGKQSELLRLPVEFATAAAEEKLKSRLAVTRFEGQLELRLIKGERLVPETVEFLRVQATLADQQRLAEITGTPDVAAQEQQRRIGQIPLFGFSPEQFTAKIGAELARAQQQVEFQTRADRGEILSGSDRLNRWLQGLDVNFAERARRQSLFITAPGRTELRDRTREFDREALVEQTAQRVRVGRAGGQIDVAAEIREQWLKNGAQWLGSGRDDAEREGAVQREARRIEQRASQIFGAVMSANGEWINEAQRGPRLAPTAESGSVEAYRIDAALRQDKGRFDPMVTEQLKTNELLAQVVNGLLGLQPPGTGSLHGLGGN